MAFLKQHRKATLELNGRKLSGAFEISLTNQGDRETMTEFISEMRKQLTLATPKKKRVTKESKPRKRPAKAKRKKKN